jgi:hypothetical protein
VLLIQKGRLTDERAVSRVSERLTAPHTALVTWRWGKRAATVASVMGRPVPVPSPTVGLRKHSVAASVWLL